MYNSRSDGRQGDRQVLTTPHGVLHVALDRSGKVPTFAPRSLSTSDRSAAVSIAEGIPRIRLATKRGSLVLTPRGCSINGGKLATYSAAQYRKIAGLIKSDPGLHGAVFELRKAATESLFGFALLHGATPSKRVADAMLASGKRQVSFAKKSPDQTCRVERIERRVKTELMGWQTSVETAWEQAVRCEETCAATFPLFEKPLELAVCTAGCGVGLFDDVWTTTWAVIDTIYDVVVEEVTHCSPVLKALPSPWGPVTVPPGLVSTAAPTSTIDPKDLKALLGPLGDVLNCLMKSDWRITALSDLDVTIPGVDQVPLGIRVCLSRACTDKLNVASIAAGLAAEVGRLLTVIGSEGMPAIVNALGLTAAVNVVATATGMTVAQILNIAAGALIILAEHAVIVAGQIVVLDFFGLAPNGVCLTYPAMLGIAAGVINPVIGLVVLGNTPIIVTPR